MLPAYAGARGFLLVFCLIFCSLCRLLKAGGGAINHKGDGEEQRRCKEADGVRRQDRLKCGAAGERNENPRDADAADAEHREHGGHERMPEAAQIAGQHLIDHGERIRHKNIDKARIADGDDLGVAVEQREQEVTGQQREQNRRAERGGSLEQRELQRLLAARRLPCAVVLPDECRARLREAVHDIVGENLHIERRAGCRHHRGAERVDRRLNHDVGDREHGTLHPGGHADAQRLHKHAAVDAKLTRFDMDVPAVPAQAAVQDSGADRIGDDRGDCHTLHRHMQDGDEEQIEQHVEHTGRGKRRQRRLGIARRTEDCRLEIVQQNDRHAEHVDAQIQERIRENVIRRAQQLQQLGGKQLTENGDRHAEQQCRQNRGVRRAAHRLPLAAPDGVGNHDIDAERNADKQVDKQTDNRAVGAHGGNRHIAQLAGEVADDRHIRGVEQLREYRRRRHRQRKLRQTVPNRAVQHIDFFFSSDRFHGDSFRGSMPHFIVPHSPPVGKRYFRASLTFSTIFQPFACRAPPLGVKIRPLAEKSAQSGKTVLYS